MSNKYKFDCDLCRDKGRDGGCPKCGKTLDLITQEKTKSVTVKVTDKLNIPSFYLGNPWDVVELKKSKIDYEGDDGFETFCKQLRLCHEATQRGVLIKNSVLVSAPLGYSKTTWVYSCLFNLYSHGYDVVPLIDTSQLKRMMTLASERPERYNHHCDFSYENYMNCDILFLSVVRGPEYIYAYETIVNILDIRSRLGKPTVVLSDWTVRELVPQDRRGTLMRLLQGGEKVDPYKYISPIEFIEYKK